MLSRLTLAFVAILALACGNGGGDNDPPLILNDASVSRDGAIQPASEGGTAVVDSGVVGADSGTIPLKCTQAELDAADFTVTGNVSPSFSESALPKQYTLHCAKIKVAMVVRFQGNFELHPMEAAGGDPGSPIPALTQTNTGGPRPTLGYLDVKFTKAGTFGYRCKTHPQDMFGAVQVVN